MPGYLTGPAAVAAAPAAVGAFAAYSSAGLSATLAANAVTLVPFTDEEYDQSGWFNNATFAYTPLVAGIYLLTATCTISNTNSGVAISLRLRKNGVVARTLHTEGTSGLILAPVLGGAVMIAANGTTDYFDVVTLCSQANHGIGSGAAQTYFSGCRVA